MKCLVRPTAAGAAVLALAFVCVHTSGQTMVDMRSQARNIDFSGAVSTRPFPVGTVLPPICTIGQTFFKADAAAGRNLYVCIATNAWAAIEGGQKPLAGSTGGIVVTPTADQNYTLDIDTNMVATRNGNNAYTGSHDFSGASSLRVSVSTSRPSNSACDAADEVGRIVVRRSDSTQQASVMYLCQATGNGSYAWKVSSYSYGAGRPQQCEPGELFFDLGGANGQQWLGCVAANSWTVLGGGSGSLPTQTSQGGKLLGTNGSTSGWRSIRGFTDDGSQLTPDGTVVAELNGNNAWTGHQRFPASAVQTLNLETNTITCNRRTVAISAATALTLTSAPAIADGADGQVCVIVNTGTNNLILQDQDALPSSNLQLVANRVTLPPKAQITLQFHASVGEWIQEGVPVAVSGGTFTPGLQDTGSVGLVAQTGPGGLTAARTVTGVNGIAVTNGDGVAGNPVLSIPGTARGDIIVHNGTTNARVPVGGDGDSLVADSTQPAGVKWSTRNVAGSNGINVSNGDWTAGTMATITMPGTVKGDIVAHDGTTNTRVAAGSDGQSLVADSTQPAGVKWSTRNVAGSNGLIVTNGDWSGGNVASIALPGSAKGDLIAHNGTNNVRLPVGTNNHCIVADSSTATGLAWKTCPGGGSSSPTTTKGDIIVHNGAGDTRQAAGANGRHLIYDSSQATGLKSVPGVYLLDATTAPVPLNSVANSVVWSTTVPALVPGDEVRCNFAATKTTGATSVFLRHRFTYGGQSNTTGNVGLLSNEIAAGTGTFFELGIVAVTNASQQLVIRNNTRIPSGAQQGADGNAVGTMSVNSTVPQTLNLEVWFNSATADTGNLLFARCMLFRGVN